MYMHTMHVALNGPPPYREASLFVRRASMASERRCDRVDKNHVSFIAVQHRSDRVIERVIVDAIFWRCVPSVHTRALCDNVLK